MADEIVMVKGDVRTIVFACEDDGTCPVQKFFSSLPKEAQARFLVLFRQKADSLKPLRGDCDKKLGEDISVNLAVLRSPRRVKARKPLSEFKRNADKARMIYFHWDCRKTGQKFLVVVHGFPKKENKEREFSSLN